MKCGNFKFVQINTKHILYNVASQKNSQIKLTSTCDETKKRAQNSDSHS